MSQSSEIMRKLASMSDRDLLARLIWGEARGELPIGQLAVASVVFNRIRDGRFGKGMKGVILKPWQFSCFNANDPNLLLLLQPPMREPFTCCLFLADLLLENLGIDGTYPDPTKGATHYFNPDVVPGRWPKPWDRSKMEFCIGIGRHQFYRELP